MKSVRLLPVVIFAALALLLFKGIGLVTNGGYVLTGPMAVIAAGGRRRRTVDEPGHAARGEHRRYEPDARRQRADDGDARRMRRRRRPRRMRPSASSVAAAMRRASRRSVAEAVPGQRRCRRSRRAVDAERGTSSPTRIGSALARGCPSVEIPVNEHGDALPLTKDGTGKIVPLAVAEGDNSRGGAAAAAERAPRRTRQAAGRPRHARRRWSRRPRRSSTSAPQELQALEGAGRRAGRPEAGGRGRGLQGHRHRCTRR